MVDALSFHHFNLIECGLWIVFSLVLGIKSLLAAPALRRIFGLLSVAFLAFGFSDYVEAHTGNWWTPLWLLCLKASCILMFVFGFGSYYRFKNK